MPTQRKKILKRQIRPPELFAITTRLRELAEQVSDLVNELAGIHNSPSPRLQIKAKQIQSLSEMLKHLAGEIENLDIYDTANQNIVDLKPKSDKVGKVIGKPTEIFISYSLQDSAFATQLRELLATQALLAWAKKPLNFTMADNNDKIRLDAIQAYKELSTPGIESLIHALSNNDDNIKLNAIQALKELGDARAIEPLINALEDDNYKIQFSAAQALIKLSTPAAESHIAALDNLAKFDLLMGDPTTEAPKPKKSKRR